MTNKKRKVIDIIPPQAAVAPQQNSGKDGGEADEVIAKKRSSAFSWIAACAAILLAGAAIYFFFPAKAELEVWPSAEEINFAVTKEIAGKFVRTEQAPPEKFYSFGAEEIETKAEGIIRIYNNFHLDQPLLAGTRFWCGGDEKLEFKTKEWMVVPTGKYLDAEVIASLPGEEFNIPFCKAFSVPGLAKTARYTAVYGESFSAMEGGESFTRVLVVEKTELENIAREYVLTQISPEQKIQENSLAIDYSSFSADPAREKITLNLEIAANVFTPVDKEVLKEVVRGADSQQLEQILVDFPEIYKVRLKLWPFWVNEVPDEAERIDLIW